jgi:hydrogenase maturation protein HypF
MKPAPTSETVLAMGADLKSTFSLQANGRQYISQYLGNLGSYQSQQYYRQAQDHLIKLMETKPCRIIVDRHPHYFSSALGEELSRVWNVPVQTVQHHEAHAWSVLAENDLILSDDSILCVVWDGTGYGNDRNTWGGEFFRYDKYEIKRIAHLDYFPVWMGDRMAKERLSALSLTSDLVHAEKILKPKFSEQEWTYYAKVIAKEPGHYTSSMGRLFDAVASLLGVCDKNTFEGQAALYLETLASSAGPTATRYPVRWKESALDVKSLMTAILQDISRKKTSAYIGHKFHCYLADVVYDLAAATQITKITFSGGVFQNALLVDLIINRFKEHDHQLFFHRELSPNDENISFGQLTVARVKNEMEHYLDDELVNNPL